ncbi:MAG TPA: type ISP restriction/modification enzyme [Pirellulales bacterium]|nr:type ISP restriction/modification enzyme [Pirellulales bacterium]
MVEKHPGLKLPLLTNRAGEKRTILPEEPFVQILDPATGTATFLVEVIDVIHRTLVAKWNQQRFTEAQQRAAWNDYVPKHLLPRLYGYELMMAPYSIAHMKIGLKLGETGYRFQSDERTRVYLTNSLEPPAEEMQQQRIAELSVALAHEAKAVNDVKRDKRFTVVIGNPPYSKISSNLTPEMRATVERYRYLDGERIKERGALQFEINLQDDYVKFFRFCEECVNASNNGIFGVITNNGYLSTPTLRGMRDSLLETFRSIWVVDLHGHLAKGEVGPDGGQEGNVFDILQGVALFLGLCRSPKASDAEIFHAERYGSRSAKYDFLQTNHRQSTVFKQLAPSPPFYLFMRHDSDLAREWQDFIGLPQLFPRNSAGIITARDALVIDESKETLARRLQRFSQATGTESAIYADFGFSESKRFDLREAQAELQRLRSFSEPIRKLLHRPFDERFIFFHPSVVWSLSRPMAEQMVGGENLALVATRQVTRSQFEHVFVSRHMIEIKACSHDRNTQLFPLFLYAAESELRLGPSAESTVNLNENVLLAIARGIGLKLQLGSRVVGKEDELTPLRVFNYTYAVLNCPSYRGRYFEFLRSDYPRIPLPSGATLFRALADLGGELVSLHLLESARLQTANTSFVGSASAEVEKVTYSRDTVWFDKGQTSGFRGVPQDVWNFHIGGYRVCQKWLKDRKGRRLSKGQMNRYERIVAAVHETIRIMREVDAVIDQHGGWPAAFVAGPLIVEPSAGVAGTTEGLPMPGEEDRPLPFA